MPDSGLGGFFARYGAAGAFIYVCIRFATQCYNL